MDQDQDICLISTVENLYVPQTQLTAYPLSNGLKCGRFLADDEGWYLFHAMKDKQVLLANQAQYYYSGEDFLAWQQAIKRGVSKDYAVEEIDKNMSLSLTETLSSSHAYRAVNKFTLWLIMFISLVLLWIERKWQTN